MARPVDELGWQEFGLCREMDPDMFFPERRDSSIVEEAKKACNLCVVRLQCLDWYLRHPHEDGIAGALLWDERLALLGLTQADVVYTDDDEDEVVDLRDLMAQRETEEDPWEVRSLEAVA